MYIDEWSRAERVKRFRDRIVSLRRNFHMNPELANEEFRTSQIIAEILQNLGLKVTGGIAGTGVAGLLEGGEDGKTVALRADMDALPIQDQKKTGYASKIHGKMHACGHDAHTAMLLGAAMVLANMKDNIKGRVKFIFQPAEESTGGARRMIDQGILKNPEVNAIFGLHVSPEIQTGYLGIKYGVANARSDTFKIVIKGKAAHGASPHRGIDAIVIAAQVITALQSIISRRIDPMASGVITLGTIRGGSQSNIIADRVELIGTVRTLEEYTRKAILKDIREIANHICLCMGGKYELETEPGYPLLVNNDDMVDMVSKAANKVIGDNVIEISRPGMGVEDFAYFLQEVPGAFWRLGTGNKGKGIECTPHNPYFDIDEDALIIGTAVHVQIVLDFLG